MNRVELPFETIRRLAEEAGREHWHAFLAAGDQPILDECINVGRAWMFFRSPDIAIPPGAGLRNCALVVSNHGEVRFTADYYPDLNKCRDYLQNMSDHFEERGI